MSETKPWHKRLPDWEAFDEIRMKVIPRYKTSGLSGDEWRQHVQVEFLHKGVVVHEAGFRDMRVALELSMREWHEATCPISNKIIEMEQAGLCDQPSCTQRSVGRFLLKRETSERGDWLDMSERYGRVYRQFCQKHLRRGDCSREDCDDNYEPMDGVGPEQSTNLEESPSVLAPPIVINLPDSESQP